MKWLMPPVPIFCVVFVSQPFLQVPQREEEGKDSLCCLLCGQDLALDPNRVP